MTSTNIPQDSSTYVGGELELFNHAANWKGYWAGQIMPYLGKRILEVGAGIGATPLALLKLDFSFEKWVCIEPDARLSRQIVTRTDNIPSDRKIEVFTGLLSDYKREDKFESVLYIDVIEHIEDERAELVRAFDLLQPGGRLVIVVPAHQYLYSEFDKAIGHFRRYNRRSLAKVIPANSTIIMNRYLDSLGLFASLANRIFLKQSYPTIKQIEFWDKMIVPISRFLDRILFYNLGKSIVLIAEKHQIMS